MNLSGNAEELKKGVENMEAFYPYASVRLRERIVAVKCEEDADFSCCIQREGGHWSISYRRKCDFFRALGNILAGEGKQTCYYEKAAYQKCGTMLDVSRDAVYTVAQLKEFLVWQAFCGLNTCYLYMEDIYRMEKYPYFGYLRGAYSAGELKELDDFADSLGIELIPCIQTLSHLATTLKWDYAMPMRDTPNTLMVGQEETYTFIKEMLLTLKDIFRTNRIHIGMDEAMDLGTGAYLRKKGYRKQYDLMTEHLKRVIRMAEELGLVPIIWDDMFYRAKDVNLDYYNPQVVLTEEDIEQVPKGVQLVYWDYYHNVQEEYECLLEKRAVFEQYLIFAGGIWKWNGWVPNYGKTFTASRAALEACKKHRVDEIFAAVWGDNGGEAPLQTVWPGLVLFGQYAYQAAADDESISRRCEAFTGLTLSAYRTIEKLDVLPGCEMPNVKTRNPSKYFLYQDLLLGAFDEYVKEGTSAHYAKCLEELKRLLQEGSYPEAVRKMLKVYIHLADVLAQKSVFGVKVRQAYRQGNRTGLAEICEECEELSVKIKALHDAFVKMWMYGSKGTGLEVHDLRLGGLLMRVNTVKVRISAYLQGDIHEMDELEQDILPFKQLSGDDDLYPICNKHHLIATQNQL